MGGQVNLVFGSDDIIAARSLYLVVSCILYLVSGSLHAVGNALSLGLAAAANELIFHLS